MATKLDSKPVINPELVNFFSGSYNSALSGLSKMRDSLKDDKFSWVAVGILLIMLISFISYYITASLKFVNQTNITRVAKSDIQAQSPYVQNAQSRKGLSDYVNKCKADGVPDAHMILTNFYVSTVNATGIFFPATDGIVSSEAAKLAVQAGARAFVFDLWPDLTPGAEFGPSIQVIESGSNWRRISMNMLSFASVLKPLIQEALQLNVRPYAQDPVFLYLRFRGKPRSSTFTITANTLRALIEPYRLPNSYNNRRAQGTLFTTALDDLAQKVVVMSNVTGEGTILSDFINVGPRDGVKLEQQPGEFRNYNTDTVKPVITMIKQNMTWIAPVSEDPSAEANNYDVPANQAIGVQFCAMNFWNNNDNLKDYMAPAKFGTYSFLIKPVAIRHIVEYLPSPQYPNKSLDMGKGPNAGAPTQPPGLNLLP